MKNPRSNSSIAPLNITFNINLNKLIETVIKCNVGSGDLSNPIDANSFVTNHHSDIPIYYKGETIVIEVTQDPQPTWEYEGEIIILCSNFNNVTKSMDYGSLETIGLMNQIFVIDTITPIRNNNVNQISLLPDGTLCIGPSDNLSCEIQIQDKLDFKDFLYIRYSIIFMVASDHFEKTCYFIIDPLLKISSEHS